MIRKIIVLQLAIILLIESAPHIVLKTVKNYEKQIYKDANVVECDAQLVNVIEDKEIEVEDVSFEECSKDLREHEEIEYDFERIERVVTHECGNDYELARAVATCIVNGCRESGYSPEELIVEYQYAKPSDFVSDAAKNACEDVLLNGNMLEDVKDSLYFYSTKGGFYSKWHESQEFVTEINDVRFFK